MSHANSFAQEVREIRVKLLLSQEQLAHAIGVSFATINRWENGKASPSRMGKAAFDNFCDQMKQDGRLREDAQESGG